MPAGDRGGFISSKAWRDRRRFGNPRIGEISGQLACRAAQVHRSCRPRIDVVKAAQDRSANDVATR